MRIYYGERDLGEWDGWPTLQEARKIKRLTEMTPPEFRRALAEMDPDANAALAVIMLARNGEEVGIDDIAGDNCMTAVRPVLNDAEREALSPLLSDEEKKALGPKG